MAMAPPLTLTFSMSGWYSRSQARTTEAKASLISMRSMSSSESFDLASTSSVAGIGAVSMICRIVGRHGEGVEPGPRRAGRATSARSSLMISTAAAPSEICDEVAAVTVPFSTKAGGSAASFSRRGVAPDPLVGLEQAVAGVASSSRHVGVHPGLEGGTISLSNRPSSMARAARSCDARANRSISSRPISQRRRDLLGALSPGG